MTVVMWGGDYGDKVRGIAPNPFTILPLWETSGAVASDISGNARHGAATGATWADAVTPMGTPAPRLDGVADYIDMLAAWQTSWSGACGTQGTISYLTKIPSAAWTDATFRRAVRVIGGTGTNSITLAKSSSNNQTNTSYVANATTSNNNRGAYSTTNWFFVALTWDRAAGGSGEDRLYFDGVQINATVTTLGTWNGGNLNTAVIGAGSTTPSEVYDGWLAWVCVWPYALTPAQIAAVHTY